MARSLGPEQFGTLSVAQAFVALFAFIASLGLPSIVVRDVVRRPADQEGIISSAFFLRLAGGLLAVLAATGACIAIRGPIRKDDEILGLPGLGLASCRRMSPPYRYWWP